MKHILPDAMLGIIGGGQLGRMFTMAARAMGYRVTVLEPDRDSPVGESCRRSSLCALRRSGCIGPTGQGLSSDYD